MTITEEGSLLPGDSSTAGVKRNAIETLGFRGVALVVAFGTTIITSRYLLPAGRGAFVLAILTVTLVSSVVGNTGFALAHFIGGRSREDHAKPVTNGLLASLFVGVLCAAILIPIDLAVVAPPYRAVAFAGAALPALFVAQTLEGTLLAVGRLRLWNLIQLTTPAVAFVGMLLLVVGFDRGISGAMIAWLTAQFVAVIMSLAASRDLWWPMQTRYVSLREMASILWLGSKLGVAGIVSLLNYRIELGLLEAYRGVKVVGIYSLSSSLAELLWLISTAIATAIVAPSLRATHEGSAAVVTRGARHALMATALAALPLAIGGALLIAPVFGNAFSGSVTPLLLLIPGVVVFAPASVLSVFFSIRLAKTKYPIAGALISLTVTGLLCLVLVPAYGAAGAAISSTGGYAVGITWTFVLYMRVAGVRAGELVPRASDLRSYREIVRALRDR